MAKKCRSWITLPIHIIHRFCVHKWLALGYFACLKYTGDENTVNNHQKKPQIMTDYSQMLEIDISLPLADFLSVSCAKLEYLQTKTLLAR